MEKERNECRVKKRKREKIKKRKHSRRKRGGEKEIEKYKENTENDGKIPRLKKERQKKETEKL